MSLLARATNRIRRTFHRQPVETSFVDEVIVDGKGHRAYVGGLWELIGQHQFRFMVDQGLQPQHVLCDVACGSLRGGVHFIPYLEPGNYLGIDILQELIDVGIEREIGQKMVAIKNPEFVVSSKFEFNMFSKQPDFVIAHSLFTHLIPDDISLCLKNLRPIAKPGTRFFASFFEAVVPSKKNPKQSDPHLGFVYTKGEMAQFGSAHGWKPNYIGDWKHPRGQKIFEYVA
jgi:hypothetical protein